MQTTDTGKVKGFRRFLNRVPEIVQDFGLFLLMAWLVGVQSGSSGVVLLIGMAAVFVKVSAMRRRHDEAMSAIATEVLRLRRILGGETDGSPSADLHSRQIH